jgi:hypothetical protein
LPRYERRSKQTDDNHIPRAPNDQLPVERDGSSLRHRNPLVAHLGHGAMSERPLSAQKRTSHIGSSNFEGVIRNAIRDHRPCGRDNAGPSASALLRFLLFGHHFFDGFLGFSDRRFGDSHNALGDGFLLRFLSHAISLTFGFLRLLFFAVFLVFFGGFFLAAFFTAFLAFFFGAFAAFATAFARKSRPWGLGSVSV